MNFSLRTQSFQTINSSRVVRHSVVGLEWVVMIFFCGTRRVRPSGVKGVFFWWIALYSRLYFFAEIHFGHPDAECEPSLKILS